MNEATLEDIGARLDVTPRDIGALRERAKDEKRKIRLQRRIMALGAAISAFLGLSLAFAHRTAENAAYPFSYEPAGGKLLHLFAFITSAGALGAFASVRNRTRQTLPRTDMNYTLVQTFFLSILIFSVSFFWADNSIFGGGLLYNAYSRQDPRIPR